MAIDTLEPPIERTRSRLQHCLGGVRDVRIEIGVLGLDDQLDDGSVEVETDEDQVVVPVHLAGRSAIVGPVGRPGHRSPCGRCLARRWQTLRSAEERGVIERGGSFHAVAPSPYLTGFATSSLAALCDRAANMAKRSGVRDVGEVWEMGLDTLEVRQYPLLADALCPACGEVRKDSADAARIELTSRRKPATDQYRLRSVSEYGIDPEAFANPICGALGSTALPALSSETTAPVTGFLRMRGPYGFHEFYWSGHADNYDDSVRLGVLEGLERYAGLWPRGLADTTVKSYDEVKSVALDPRECGLYSDDYYRDFPHFHVPFKTDEEIAWVWGYSLRDRQPLLVPEQLVYYGVGTLGGKQGFVMECSNGCASGSCAEEAILHGMLELIERDAFTVAWHGKAHLPELDPTTCADPRTLAMIDRVGLAGYDVRLFDNRIDLPIPVVTGVAVRRDGGLGNLCFAAGSGLDPEEAVRAALCEIASYVPGFDRRTEERLDEARAMVSDYEKVLELKHHALLFALPEMAPHADFLLANGRRQPMAELYDSWYQEQPHNLDLRDDVHFVLDELVDAGYNVIAVDQTSPEQRRYDLRTMCVIVPGLVPIDFGWRRQRAHHMQRTRTAFRKAGWRDSDLTSEEMNFVPHPFP